MLMLFPESAAFFITFFDISHKFFYDVIFINLLIRGLCKKKALTNMGWGVRNATANINLQHPPTGGNDDFIL